MILAERPTSMNASVRFLVWGSMPLGSLLGGWLGHTTSVLTTLWVAAGIGLVATLPVVASPLLRSRDLPPAPVHGTPRG